MTRLLAYAASISIKAVLEFSFQSLRIALAKLLRLGILALPLIPLGWYRDLAGLLLIIVVLGLALLLHLLLLILLVLLLLLLLDRSANFVTEALDLIINGDSQIRDLLELFESEVKQLGAGRLIGGVVPNREVFVLKGLFGGDAV